MSEPQFVVGEQVRIADRISSVHHRVPAYAKGKVGVVERICGMHGQPENFIRGDGSPLTRLYRISLTQADLWPGYRGVSTDRLDIEIFEHWLEAMI